MGWDALEFEGTELKWEGTDWVWEGMEWYGMELAKYIYHVTLEASRKQLEDVTGHAARGGHGMVYTWNNFFIGGDIQEAFRTFLRLLRSLF